MASKVIGRDAELEIVDRFLERTAEGTIGLVFFGEPGIGKTALWREALARAEANGMLVLRCGPAESERTLALGGLTDVLADIDEAHFQRLPEVQREAVEVALLRSAPMGTYPDQRALSVATTALMRGFTADRPAVLAVDDAQWLDDSSAAILAYATRRIGARPLRLLLTVRGESAASRELIAAVHRDQLERIDVGPMPLATLHQLFVEALGRSFPRVVLVRIEEASRGNPFFALELGRALIASGASLTPGQQLPVPATLGELVRARIVALPLITRETLLLAAAAEQPSLELLEKVRPGAAKQLEPALRASIASIDRGAIRFAHPLFAEAVVAGASPGDVRRAHAALAEAVTSEEARARHLAGAADGPDQVVAERLAEAARHARDRGAALDAASLYEQAGRLTPPAHADRRIELATLAAESLFIDVSEIVEADAILGAALTETPPGPARALALSLRAIIRYYHGDAEEAVGLGEAALEEIGDDPTLRATVLGRLAFLTMQVDMERGLDEADQAVRLLAPDGLDGNLPDVDPDLLANAVLLRASAELGLVRGLRHAEIEHARRLITRDGRSWEREGADGNSFGIARQTDDLDTSIAMTEMLIRSKSGPGGDDPFNLVQLSGLQLLRGQWEEAEASAEGALEGYAREGAGVFPSWALRGVALVAAHKGRTDEARRLASDGLDLAVRSGNPVLQILHHHILGFVALSLGDVVAADAHLTAAASGAEEMGIRHPGRFKLDGDRLEVAIALGELTRGRAIIDVLEGASRLAPTPWVLAVSARGRGLLRAAEGDLEGAAAALTDAIRAHEALPMPFERARTLLIAGRIHRRRKEKRLADERLRESLGIFESLGAPIWADLARAELGRIGLRPRASSDLTETESRVAALAATGLSSRQIAERVFLTPKSVGNVLGRVYEKLGIHSRAELGARMADAGTLSRDSTGGD